MEWLRKQAAELPPNSFALVMATGIISIASHLLGMTGVAVVLLWANVAFFAVLWVLTILRLAAHPRAVLADLGDHAKGPGFFTTVAGTCVLGSQAVIVAGYWRLAAGLFFLGVFIWVCLTYSFLPRVMVREAKPSLDAGLNGAWLIIVVATQSVSVLASLLAPRFAAAQEAYLFTALCFHLAGSLLYILIITLLFHRLAFFALAPAGLSPVTWVAMGAAAITTLAGARLMLNANSWTFLAEILPFLKGFTLVYWATATWWIPLLVVLWVWRHIVRRYPLRYETPYWSLVFPLGMYTAATFVLARGEGLDFLAEIPRYFIWVAYAAWALAFAGMTARLLRRLFVRGEG